MASGEQKNRMQVFKNKGKDQEVSAVTISAMWATKNPTESTASRRIFPSIVAAILWWVCDSNFWGPRQSYGTVNPNSRGF